MSETRQCAFRMTDDLQARASFFIGFVASHARLVMKNILIKRRQRNGPFVLISTAIDTAPFFITHTSLSL